MRIRVFASAVLAACLVVGTALADETPLLPVPVDPEKVDFTGTWNYSTANHTVSGRCPNGTPMAGTLFISHTGGEAGVMVQSGAVCNPASMCMYSGGILEGALVVSNTDTVDEEGGSASNAMQLFFGSASEGWGGVSSSYVHPKGFECQWRHDIRLWRSEKSD